MTLRRIIGTSLKPIIMASIQSYILHFLLRKTINWNRPLNEIREFQKNIEKKEIIPPGIKIEKININGVESEWFIPEQSHENKTLIYLHGGGYCLGIVHSNRNFVLKLAAEFRISIILLNYRLAPENPYPSALNDSVSLYSWVINETHITPQNIGIIADSSGCGLALSALQVLRNKQLPLPKFQVFMSPVIDLSRRGESFKTMAANDPFCINDEYFVDNHYLKGNDPMDPFISPIYADLAGYPETMIQASEYDVFQSDSVMLQQKLITQNVKVHFKLWPRMWHIFQMSYAMLPEGKKALNEIKVFIENEWKLYTDYNN
jgi:epsilon-lactone hydrolase